MLGQEGKSQSFSTQGGLFKRWTSRGKGNVRVVGCVKMAGGTEAHATPTAGGRRNDGGWEGAYRQLN